MRAPRPDGQSVEIGSVQVLFDQLNWLNDRTFQADSEQVAAWREMEAPMGCDLLQAARRGFASLLHAVAAALHAPGPGPVRIDRGPLGSATRGRV